MKRNSPAEKRNKIINSIWHEREHQLGKWGVQHHRAAPWGLILAEEYGEAMKEANDVHFRQDLKAQERLKKELIQTAAVCVAWIEDLNEKE